MTDVFFCYVPTTDLIRLGFRDACLARWQVEPYTHLAYVTPSNGCSPREFQRVRRVHADREAKSDPYVVADDDCLLSPGKPVIRTAVEILLAHPEFSVLSLWPENHEMGPWTSVPEGYEPFEDDEVLEHAAAGAVRLCRKGHLSEWPEMKSMGKGYDGEHGEAIRAAGKRIGFFKGLRINHLGKGYPQIR